MSKVRASEVERKIGFFASQKYYSGQANTIRGFFFGLRFALGMYIEHQVPSAQSTPGHMRQFEVVPSVSLLYGVYYGVGDWKVESLTLVSTVFVPVLLARGHHLLMPLL